MIPPTVPATRNTYSGRSAANQRLTAAWSRRSSSDRLAVRIVAKPSSRRRSTTADPTRPAWPATKTRPSRGMAAMPGKANGGLWRSEGGGSPVDRSGRRRGPRWAGWHPTRGRSHDRHPEAHTGSHPPIGASATGHYIRGDLGHLPRAEPAADGHRHARSERVAGHEHEAGDDGHGRG